MMFPQPSPSSVQLENDIKEIASCQFMHVFDRYVSCNSVGLQLKNTYRYGQFKDCSQEWKDFKFIIGLKTKPKNVQLSLCKQYYKEQIVHDVDPMLKERKAL